MESYPDDSAVPELYRDSDDHVYCDDYWSRAGAECSDADVVPAQYYPGLPGNRKLQRRYPGNCSVYCFLLYLETVLQGI